MLHNHRRYLCPICTHSSTFFNNVLFCKYCNFEYYHNVASASVAILEINEHILLLERANEPMVGKLHLPGGFVSPKETAEQALVREVFEELNLSVNKYSYIFSEPNNYFFSGINYHVIDLYFKISVKNISNLKINNESKSYIWKKKHTIKDNEVAFDSIRKCLKKLEYIG